MEAEKIPNIPPGAKLVHAFGELSLVSLSDEYNPSPERRAEWTQEFLDLARREAEESIESRNIRL